MTFPRRCLIPSAAACRRSVADSVAGRSREKQNAPAQGNLPWPASLLGGEVGVSMAGFDGEWKPLWWNDSAAAGLGEGLHDSAPFRSLARGVREGSAPCQGNLTLHSAAGRVQTLAARLCHSPGAGTAETVYTAAWQDVSPMLEARRTIEELRARTARMTRQSEKEAEFLRELLRHVIETVQLALAVTDLQSGMIAYVNEGFEELVGQERLALIGNTIDAVLAAHPETAALLSKYLGEIRDGTRKDESSGHREMNFPCGRRDVELYGRTIAVEGMENQFILLIIEDHTERERLQTKLVQSEKLAAIGQLAAGIAHEIRNPLNTIFNALYDLQEIIENPTQEVAEDITISMEEIKRVQEIINNLLDFARDSERSIERTSLNDVLRKTLRLVQHDLKNRSIKTKLRLGTIPLVRVSENSLKQILINLVTNAAQAMEGGGTVSIETSVLKKGAAMARPAGEDPLVPVVVAEAPGRPEGSHVLLKISDTGSGISARVLPNIFNPFFTTKDPGAGTGLGLSVVHSLIRDSGGAIAVESREGRGTVFTIELPIAEDE